MCCIVIIFAPHEMKTFLSKFFSNWKTTNQIINIKSLTQTNYSHRESDNVALVGVSGHWPYGSAFKAFLIYVRYFFSFYLRSAISMMHNGLNLILFFEMTSVAMVCNWEHVCAD